MINTATIQVVDTSRRATSTLSRTSELLIRSDVLASCLRWKNESGRGLSPEAEIEISPSNGTTSSLLSVTWKVLIIGLTVVLELSLIVIILLLQQDTNLSIYVRTCMRISFYRRNFNFVERTSFFNDTDISFSRESNIKQHSVLTTIYTIYLPVCMKA